MRKTNVRSRAWTVILAALGLFALSGASGCDGDGGAPRIPHTVTGRTDCLGCHGSGGGGAPQVPADHAGRSNAVCLDCHSVVGSGY
ncbi:MAG: hypothetical protein HY907_17230 [Deltaproteobacteria bacterium]|nr:hypothetical protein [Deltaproteobacteria bacterium]